MGEYTCKHTLEFYNNGTLIGTWTPYTTTFTECPNDYCGSLKYIGTINTATFNEVLFRGSDVDDKFAFDDMTVGSLQQVPEPSSFAMVGAGLLGLAMAARRRRVG